MRPNGFSPNALSAARYVPHQYYLEGQYDLFPQSDESALYPRAPSRDANYDFSATDSIWRKEGGPQTVEQIVTRGYLTVPNTEPETAILRDKKHTSWLGLDDVIEQVRQRRAIYDRNFEEIEEAKCYAMDDLFAWERDMGRPADYQQHYVLGKRLQELYGRQRAERVLLWQDVSRLRQTLPESVREYLSALRKIEILEGTESDGP